MLKKELIFISVKFSVDYITSFLFLLIECGRIRKFKHRGGYNFWKRLVRNVSLVVRQRRLRGKKIFNFPMFHIASHFVHQGISNSLSSKIWNKTFQNLSKQQCSTFFFPVGGGGLLESVTQMHGRNGTIIFANYPNCLVTSDRLVKIRLKYRYLKVLHKISQNV